MSTESKLYHRDVGFPKTFHPPKSTLHLHPTYHAAVTATERSIRLPCTLDASTVDWFEVAGFESARFVGEGPGIQRCFNITKLVGRQVYDTTHDLCMVLASWYPDGGFSHDWHVVTCWLNRRSDKHATLDRSKYTDPATGEPALRGCRAECAVGCRGCDL